MDWQRRLREFEYLNPWDESGPIHPPLRPVERDEPGIWLPFLWIGFIGLGMFAPGVMLLGLLVMALIRAR